MTKRVIAALTAIVFASVGVIFDPSTVLAGVHYETSEEIVPNVVRIIQSDDTVDTVVASAPVHTNHGHIGTVDTGASVESNQDLIDTNYGTVTVNETGSGGGGIITDNFGTVGSNQYIVVNNYDNATVTNAGSAEEGAEVQNQYWSVTLTDYDNAAFSGDFVEKQVNSAGDRKQFLKETQDQIGGVITLTPDANHELTSNGNPLDSNTCTYTLEQSGSSFVVTISTIRGVTTLSLAQLNLVLSAIQQNNDLPANVVVRVDDSVNVEDSAPAQEPAASSQPVANSKLITASQINEMIGLTNNTIDFGDDPSFDIGSAMALFGAGSEIKCSFTHNGKRYIMTIKPADTSSEQFLACLAVLDSEPGKQAGPLRLAQIFGAFDVSIIEDADDIIAKETGDSKAGSKLQKPDHTIQKPDTQQQLEGNTLVVDPEEKDQIKNQYQYLNRKYKLSIKVQ